LAVLAIDSKYVTQTVQFGDSKSLQAGQTVSCRFTFRQ